MRKYSWESVALLAAASFVPGRRSRPSGGKPQTPFEGRGLKGKFKPAKMTDEEERQDGCLGSCRSCPTRSARPRRRPRGSGTETSDSRPDASPRSLGFRGHRWAKQTLGCTKRDDKKGISGQPGLLVPPPGRGGDRLQPGRSEESHRGAERQPRRATTSAGSTAQRTAAATGATCCRRSGSTRTRPSSTVRVPPTPTTTRSWAIRARSTPTMRAAIRRSRSTRRGAAYFSCVIFDVSRNANGLFVDAVARWGQRSFYFNVPSSITRTRRSSSWSSRTTVRPSSTTRTSSPPTAIRGEPATATTST